MLPFTPLTFNPQARNRSRSSRSVPPSTGGTFQSITLKSHHRTTETSVANKNKNFESVFEGIVLEPSAWKLDGEQLACSSAGVPPEQAGTEWWLQRVLVLSADKRTGWVVAQCVDEFRREQEIAAVCAKETFDQRLAKVGFRELEAVSAPRKRCKVLQNVASDKHVLLDELAQRSMLAAISDSLASYASGIRCWAAFLDASSVGVHFSADELMVMRYTSMFTQSGTMHTYLKHLKWAHRFLRLPCEWYTDSLRQVCRGRSKQLPMTSERLALQAPAVQKITEAAEKEGDTELAAMVVVSRLCLLRVPSECVPLQTRGDHSVTSIHGEELVIQLTRRKPTRRHAVIRRLCCCASSGKRLCAVHKLLPLLRAAEISGRKTIFSKSMREFVSSLRRLASAFGVPNASRLGSRALRRGMARDILDAGGTLSMLLRASDWRSSAFVHYLPENQSQELAIANLVIDHSDSE